MYRGIKWLLASFGPVGWEQIVFHLTTKTEGTPKEIYRRMVIELIAKPLVVSVVFIFVSHFVDDITHGVFGWVIFFISWVTILLVATHIFLMFNKSSRIGKIIPKDDWFKRFYAAPNVVKEPELNLIWIFFESLERSKVNRGFLFENQANLRKISNLPGTGWTLGGMIASQCGLPLMPVGIRAGSNFTGVGSFLGGIQGIGDILKNFGYENTFIGGADKEFSGKDSYLKNHGYQSIYGKNEIRELTKKNFPDKWWGYEDKVVLDQAYKIILDQYKCKKKFNVTILTLDTHGPYGFDHSEGKPAKNIDSIYESSLKLVEQFIDNLNSEGVLDNSAIVVSGDHPFMGPEKFKLLSFKNFSRRNKDIFVMIKSKFALNCALDNKIANHFDLFPTIFHALGGEFLNSRAGLGVNLYSNNSLSEQYSDEILEGYLRKPSNEYLKSW